MDDLQIAGATALRDIFGSSDSGSSSYENLGCENNTISLADEITSLNVVQGIKNKISTLVLILFLLQFHDAYTKDIFKKVRKEIADMIYCHLDPNNEIDVSSVLVLRNSISRNLVSNWYCKEFLYTMEFRANGQDFDCNCRKFDFCGLLCKHIFEVMKIKNVTMVHERYILRRWRKDVLRRHSSIVYSGGYSHMTDEYKKFQEIERALHEAVDLCKNNPASMGFLKREMDELIEKIRSGDIQVDQAQHMDNDASIQSPNYASIRDPTYVRNDRGSLG
ncbi:hypothetical protein Scep_005716 [Stephania cephalantha]|uniref:SWIM-type domain-containing protein n=1 Tax=Stephania cephalantha TaxID=152367 RepID=A0AAP0PWN0_9MAGN